MSFSFFLCFSSMLFRLVLVLNLVNWFSFFGFVTLGQSLWVV